MKPQVFFPFLLAAAGLTALMLLFASSAITVVGLSAGADAGEFAAPDASQPITTTDPLSLPWQVVTTGIDYVQLTLTNPANNVYIARMHRDALSVTLDTSIASGALVSGKETVSQMAERYDQAINYWGQAPLTPTWGSRNQVVVAINGSYYNKDTGLPFSGMVNSGWYAKRFDNLGGGSGFAWKLNRSAFIGECVNHRPDRQLLTFSVVTMTQQIDGVNVPRTNNTLILYTPQYDSNTGTDASGAEVLVELSKPSLIIPTPRMVTGTVTAIYTDTGSTPIPFDHVVLSAKGTARDILLANVQVGDVIGISQEITSYQFDCSNPLSIDWSKTYASLSGDYYFLRNGVIRHFDNEGAIYRDPRTAIVFNKDYIYFVVVDGRSWVSQGMTIDELAIFARDTLSATYGIAQDGGGSSTMVVNDQVLNNTLCNNVFCNHFIFLPMVGQGSGATTRAEWGEPITQTPAIQSNEVDAVTAERYVANGMMMVIVEPMQASTTFTPTQVVKTVSLSDLRLGPGTNYVGSEDIPADTLVVIVPHPLNGVLAKGSYWWKVDFNGKVGWVPESSLIPALDSWR